jgi:hypothetical protein
MPKIVINEYDKTKADVTEYSNFSIVVPGYVNSTVCTDTSKVFDENGIYECSSVSDFESKIGKVPASAQEIEAEGPTKSELEEIIDQEKF